MSVNEEYGYLEARDYEFCPWCGEALVEKQLDGRQRRTCPKCGFIWYKNPVPAAGAIIHNDHGLILVKRKFPPSEGDWCLPAGFQEYNESPMECCIREVKEETGLDIKIDGLFWNYKAGDDPRTMVVLILYLASITGGEKKPGDDAIEVEYFGMDNIPSNIAFTAHRKALSQFKSYLKNDSLPVND
ncbi:MAG: NUDIX hydrolase [candidate division Zixibacteria bacterium]